MTRKATITDLGLMFELKQMNNPLTNILLCLDLLSNPLSSEQNKPAYFAIIEKSAYDMAAAVNDMYACLAEKYGVDQLPQMMMISDDGRGKKKIPLL